MLSRFICVRLCNPMDHAWSAGSSVHGILQKRTQECIAIFLLQILKDILISKLYCQLAIYFRENCHALKIKLHQYFILENIGEDHFY